MAELETTAEEIGRALHSFAQGHLATMEARYDEAAHAYQQAHDAFVRLDDANRAGDMLSFACLALFYKGDFDAALTAGQRALEIHEGTGSQWAMARDLSNLGNVYNERREFDEAMRAYRRSIEFYDLADDREHKATVLANLGTVYIALADYPMALEQLYTAGNLLDDGDHEPNIARILGNIGNVYMYMGSFDKALPRYERAIEIHRRLGNRKSAAIILGNMGSTFGQQGDAAKAVAYCREALQEHQAIGDVSGVHFATALVIHYLLKLDQVEEATKLLAEIRDIRIEDPIVQINLATSQAEVLERAGDVEGAITIIEEQLLRAQSLSLRSEASDLHLRLRDLAVGRADMPSYVQHNKEHQRIWQEITGMDAVRRVAEQE